MSADGTASRDRLRQAVDGVRQARGAPPPQGKQTFHQSLLLVIAVRNALLRTRAEDSVSGSDAGNGRWWDRLNSVLSLMSSVEFPLGGYHAERMDAIERELEALAAPAAADAALDPGSGPR
jgi:hypothetical protein